MAPKGTAKTTATELVNEYSSIIAGKVVLTTGVSPGGLGATYVEKVAAGKPKLLILAGRNPDKLKGTQEALAASGVATKLLQLDLSSLAGARSGAETVNGWADVPQIDVLCNNAGIMAVPYSKSVDGFESQLATNHLGHFLFTNLIMDKLLAAGEPRIVSVSSNGHRLGHFRFSDYNFDDGKTYNPWRAYGQSKTANMLFAVSLAKKLGSKGLTAVSLHPGVISVTGLSDHIDWSKERAGLQAVDKELGFPHGWSSGFTQKTPDEGASTHVFGSFAPELKSHNGAYLEDAHVADPWTETVVCWATNAIEAEKLWRLSEKLVGQEFSY